MMLFQFLLLGIALLERSVWARSLGPLRFSHLFFLPLGMLVAGSVELVELFLKRFFQSSPFQMWELLAQVLREGVPLWLLFASFVILAPVAEELFFRVYWYSWRRLRTDFWRSALPPSLAFASLHLPYGLPAVLLILPFALLLCGLFEKYRHPLPPILFHAGWNFVAFLAISP